MSLGAVVKTWREERGWKQAEVARRSGGLLKQSTVSYVEADAYARISDKTLQGLARAFGVTVDALLAAAGGADVTPAPGPPMVELPAGLDPAWVADFLKYGHRLSEQQRRNLLQLARDLAAAEVEDETRAQRPGDQRLAEGPQGSS
jgi:transcriptional regulator with XRE-family HTH domain